MAATRFKILAAAAALMAAGAAAAQTYQPGPAVRNYNDYRTTGAPSGFTLPSVPIQRRNDQSQPVRPSVQPVAPVQPPPPLTAPAAENHAPPVQEKAKPAPKSQSVSSAAQSLPAAAPAKYVKGMSLTGRGKAYDGHSLVVDGHAVRLDGADAPGLLQQCKTAGGASWRCGEESYRRLAALVDGQKVTCRVEGQAGEGAAAVCSFQGTRDVAEVMVREGLAIPNGHDKGRYSAAASSARAGRVGMWVGTFEAPWKWRESNAR